MKFVKETTSKGIQIPAAAMKLSGFESGGKVELHASEDTLVVLKQRMTAMELLRAAKSLQTLVTDLHVHLAKVCGPCTGCDGECPFEDGDEVDLPDYLREEAGIPEKAKLCASVDEEEHTVTISEADYDHDLRDVPEEVLEMFKEAGICVGELEERLILGDVVYGN
ncbi:AbrB/MazE/SpoVT family DNA-binding domain-containing protein [Dysosmobacter welbionis]